jgi:glycosyltransferase involved in cell wall biosynthesis
VLIWIVTIGEPLPVDSGNQRLLRSGILSQQLSENGHKVVWWTSSFDHMQKQHRSEDDKSFDVSHRLRIQLLHGCGYRRNISLSRIIDHRQLARAFARIANNETTPDIILCSLPPLELPITVIKYGQRLNVPVIIDIRDLWPDLFLDILPHYLQWGGKIVLSPMFTAARTICRNATGLIGLTNEYLQWGLDKANREKGETDNVFPMGYIEDTPSDHDLKKAREFLDKQGINYPLFVISFIGTIGHQIDLHTVFEAARKLSKQNINIRFVICGRGDKENWYKTQAAGFSNIQFLGWIVFAEIWELLRRSQLGLVPFKRVRNYELNITNKPIEYLSAGVPILTKSHGALGNLVTKQHCGFIYDTADDLINIITELYNNRDKLKAFSVNATRVYKNEFNAKTVYGRVEKHLINCCTEAERLSDV